MKIKLYPKELLEAAWKQDKKLYAHGDAAAPPKCLRCGAPLAAHLMVNALSRYADVQICEACGMDEALRDAAHTPLPLVEWDAVKSGHLKKKRKSPSVIWCRTALFQKCSSTPTSLQCSSSNAPSANLLIPVRITMDTAGGQPGTMRAAKRRRQSW